MNAGVNICFNVLRINRMPKKQKQAEPIWIARDLSRCSGCRKCEIACSLHHENQIWPEASRIRVFMLVPGVEFPHFCTQCRDYPCVQACPVEALTVCERTGAVVVNTDTCTACGNCIDACPGEIPHMHPKDDHVVICDLCGGDPECVKVCREGGWNVLKNVPRTNRSYELYARTPEEITHDLAIKMYGEKAEDLL
jgi:Fe-S-cluster-containing hydrogenase component 2